MTPSSLRVRSPGWLMPVCSALSGAGPDATQYGPAWGDAHLPLRNDEPTSLLTTDLVGSFLDAARGLQAYQGIKIQTPADATVERRLAMITSIHDVMATA